MVIVGKPSFRVREPCPSFYLFGCLYYTIRASRFTRGGGDFEKAPATKATKAQNFPNSLSIYYFKISFYKNTVLSLQLADKWRNQAICCCTEPAQNRHRTAQNSRPPPQHPFTYTPNPPQKLHLNVQLNAPAPRINSRIFLLVKAKGNNKDRFAHPLKVANQSSSVAEGSPARCVSEREKGENLAPGDSKGRSPWRAFGDFPRDGKVTRGWRGGAPSP